MCGICGELRFDGRAADLPAVGRMRDALKPRRPDHAGQWHGGPVAIGHTRLSIIDLS